ncbi:dihydrofolate reductase [Cesiribacter andamanensis]|uniref:Dihydrofolate reductase n=1 Tax=Cesiribacter andamanensis AMV16 TaxID=1279009 RepID=M7NC60_9BACT|nr:dihydrofolate reductase [Cesiribacter andamanensis]EMR04822.1 Dihydrofolate reductase [Cesiribacter andamanensis AMV16]
MIRSIIVARADNRVIGKDNGLIWHMPHDLRFFKETTSGHYVIMGRKSYESLNKPLPGRLNIIVTRNRGYFKENCLVMNSLEAALELAAQQQQQEVFILGGGEIYQQALDKGLVDRIYLTEIKESFEGDTYFPELQPGQWTETHREEYTADAQNPHDYAFVRLERS